MSKSTTDWKKTADQLDIRVQNVIDGRVIECANRTGVEKRAARNGEPIYMAPEGTAEEADKAVDSALRSFNDKRWRGKSLSERQSIIAALAGLIEENAEQLALYDCLEVGKPISHALGEVPIAAGMLRDCAHLADKFYSSFIADGSYSAHIRRKPVGVVGAIIGWNYPLIMAAHKVAPALIMGNSVILKPSENTVLSAARLAELALDAGVPEGVLNVVQGSGAIVGTRLTEHSNVDLLSFTGSTATGKTVMIAAGQSNMKRLMLECGGKSPYLVFEDCRDYMDAIAADVVATAFQNQSANCMAGSRLLVQQGIADEFLEKVISETQSFVPNDPFDPDTAFGAIMNEGHLKRVLSYVEQGQTDGATLLCGGERVRVDTNSDTQGYYMSPAVLRGMSAESALAQEEIFGPILSVMTFRDDTEAIALANNTCFGLSAYAATSDFGRSQRLSEELRAGSVYLTATANPFSAYHELAREGHRQSGFGAEYGFPGLASYTVGTTVHQWT